MNQLSIIQYCIVKRWREREREREVLKIIALVKYK